MIVKTSLRKLLQRKGEETITNATNARNLLQNRKS
jgi:hypothetical protein